MTDFVPPRQGGRRSQRSERPLSRPVASLFEPSTTLNAPSQPIAKASISAQRTRHQELLGIDSTDASHIAVAQHELIQRASEPEVPGVWTIEPYASCSHQCTYCSACGVVSTWQQFPHAVTPPSAVETVRQLEMHLMRKQWRGQPLVLSGKSDPYQPRERSYRLTAHCLRVLNQFRNPVVIATKNSLVVRDLELLEEMADRGQVHVVISLASLDRDLSRQLEPGTASPETRLHTIAKLANRGIPVMAQIAPLIPGVNDHEIPKLLALAAEAGAKAAVMHPLRLPSMANGEFYDWLEAESPLSTKRIRQYVSEAKRQSQIGSRLSRRSKDVQDELENARHSFELCLAGYKLAANLPPLNREEFRRTPGGWHQPSIFDTTSFE